MIRKGVVLAGGSGTRMLPATKVTNKHLLPVGNEPIIYYPIRFLLRHGVTKVVVTLGGNDVGDIIEILCDEDEFNDIEFTFRYQRKAGGIAEALLLSEDFVGDENFCLCLGDNILLGSLGDAFDEFDRDTAAKAMVFLKEVPDPQRFGVAVIRDNRIVEVIEKPENPPSSLAIIGAYLYTADVFSVASRLERSDRGELEISDVQSHYMNSGALRYREIDNDWTDAGTPYSLTRAMMSVLTQDQRDRIWRDLHFNSKG